MGFSPEYPPLTQAERDEFNAATTSPARRERLYAKDLRATACAYAKAADAPGLRKDAARYLASEATRLTNEAGLHFDRAEELEART